MIFNFYFFRSIWPRRILKKIRFIDQCIAIILSLFFFLSFFLYVLFAQKTVQFFCTISLSRSLLCACCISLFFCFACVCVCIVLWDEMTIWQKQKYDNARYSVHIIFYFINKKQTIRYRNTSWHRFLGYRTLWNKYIIKSGQTVPIIIENLNNNKVYFPYGNLYNECN